MAVNAGQYDQRITLQRRSTAVDALGQESTSWSDLASCWSKVRPARGRDRFGAGEQRPEIDVQFCVRYRIDIDPNTDRVLWNGKAYDIVGTPANVNGANVELEVNCTGGVRDALR